MKLFRIGAFALLAVAVIALTSCGKYEEGPGFSLLTKKARLVGEWTLSEVKVNGTAQELSGYTVNLSIKKDETYTYKWSSGGFSVEDSGTWKFSDDKMKFIITDQDGDVSESEIVRLANKELKVKAVDGSIETVSTYVQ
jgi:hypothetical protein